MLTGILKYSNLDAFASISFLLDWQSSPTDSPVFFELNVESVQPQGKNILQMLEDKLHQITQKLFSITLVYKQEFCTAI